MREQLEADRQEIFNLRFQSATQQLENPRRIREVRRNIARILTLLDEQAANNAVSGRGEEDGLWPSM